MIKCFLCLNQPLFARSTVDCLLKSSPANDEQQRSVLLDLNIEALGKCMNHVFKINFITSSYRQNERLESAREHSSTTRPSQCTNHCIFAVMGVTTSIYYVKFENKRWHFRSDVPMENAQHSPVFDERFKWENARKCGFVLASWEFNLKVCRVFKMFMFIWLRCMFK